MRATPSRLAVLDALRASRQPMSHGELATHLGAQAWDPATLYRNLVDFAKAGLVRRTDLGDHVWRFELATNEHHGTSRHPHFVCSECGERQCLPAMELVLPRASAPRSVRQHRVEIQLRGLCDACA